MTDDPVTRVARLRSLLGESQSAFGRRIGVSQNIVSRIEIGAQQETEPQRLLLDLLERDIAEGRIAVPPSDVSALATAESQSDAA
jgi:transcriptional regulator with XRE-family HTH domain